MAAKANVAERDLQVLGDAMEASDVIGVLDGTPTHPHSAPLTIPKVACWVCRSNLALLERERAPVRQFHQLESTEAEQGACLPQKPVVRRCLSILTPRDACLSRHGPVKQR